MTQRRDPTLAVAAAAVALLAVLTALRLVLRPLVVRHRDPPVALVADLKVLAWGRGQQANGGGGKAWWGWVGA